MTTVVRWDPFAELSEVRHTMDRVFGRRRIRPWRVFEWDTAEGFLPVDVYETDEEVVVTASLPGSKPEDVEISVIGDRLTIKSESKEEREEENPRYYRRERRVGARQRTLTLPVEVDADLAKAAFDDGVLDLRLPKVPEIRPKTIEVKARQAEDGKDS